MKLYGNGPVAIRGDRALAEQLGWLERRRSLPAPERELTPREGDSTREPWIAPPTWAPSAGARALWQGARDGAWSYLAGVPGVARHVAALARPPRQPARVAICGLGRVGGTAAALLAATPVRRSGIGELLLHDVDPANQERWLLELQATGCWRGSQAYPAVRGVEPDRVFEECDVFLFLAATAVPPIGAEGDVRMVQLSPNRAAMQGCLARARSAGFTGLFLAASDPVECMAQAAFHDSNAGPDGGFTGEGLAPERVAGLALNVMWGRALATARERGWGEVSRRGGAFGPHTTEVVVFDDLLAPDRERSEALTQAARSGNFRVRDTGHLPYVGPAISSIALSLPPLLAGREVLASTLVDGVYFGGPARLDWGVLPAARRVAPGIRREVEALHAFLRQRMAAHGLQFT